MNTTHGPQELSSALPHSINATQTDRMHGAMRRYSMRLGSGMALYTVSLLVAIVLRGAGIGDWLPALLTLPSVVIIAWAVAALYRDSDEFGRRKLAESFVLAFAIGVPILLTVGLLEAFGGPHLSWLFAFAVMMGSWVVGSTVAIIRYR
ncbi:hypothetical protein EII31_06325 [Leucobacter sp. OH2974_COT-288]|uniref:Fatty acid desaturase n=1 Tax=Canibacter oris TaxID=1365628 RepID=A0A840DGV5_9MICO|nr:hypothetical protein [Canibacter oris]MBB4071970.1 fatty acid desaturase [Canibacter oris]RRD35247.1 hypothetical protein EII31_06325 [Leucobacter sp. OH2974_COT-288]